MIEAISLGEALIDFISYQNDVLVMDSPGFKKALGGAPTNVAVGLAKQGIKTAFIGKVGDDPFGHYIKKTLENYKVDTSHMVLDKKNRTTLAFVSRFRHGQNDFTFYRHPGADMMLRESEIKESLFKQAGVFHFGSISLINQPSHNATLKAITFAKKYGLLVSYDPNLRLSLWDSPEAAKKGIRLGLKYCDIVKISDQEWEFITGIKSFEKGSRKLLQHGIKLVVISLGAKGCYYNNGKDSGYIKGFKVKAIDTTGAGDAFMAAVLSRILRQLTPKRHGALMALTYKQNRLNPVRDSPDRNSSGRNNISNSSALANNISNGVNLRDPELKSIMKFANAAGALATTKVGATEGLPTEPVIQKFLSTAPSK